MRSLQTASSEKSCEYSGVDSAAEHVSISHHRPRLPEPIFNPASLNVPPGRSTFRVGSPVFFAPQQVVQSSTNYAVRREG